MTLRTAVLATATVSLIATTVAAETASPGEEERAKIINSAREIMQQARFCTLITVDGEGHPRARMMDPLRPGEGLNVWLATNPLTRKVGQINADPHVTLLYFDATDPSYVTILGTAEIVEDAAEKAKHWKDDWAAFYSDEHRGDDFVLIRVTPRRLEIVSESRGFSSDPETWLPAAIEFHAAQE